jgi:hypothetical protein
MAKNVRDDGGEVAGRPCMAEGHSRQRQGPGLGSAALLPAAAAAGRVSLQAARPEQRAASDTTRQLRLQ